MEKPKVKRTSSLRIGWIPDPPVIEVLCRFTNISVKTAGGISKRSFLVTIHRQIVRTVTVQTWRSNSLCLRSQDLLRVTWQNKVAGAAAPRSPACVVWGQRPKFRDAGQGGSPQGPYRRFIVTCREAAPLSRV